MNNNWTWFITKKLGWSNATFFSSTIIRLSVVSVALSLAVMLITGAIIEGFKREISEKIYGFWGHIQISSIQRQSSLESEPIPYNPPFLQKLDSLTDKNGNDPTKPLRHYHRYVFKPVIVKTKVLQEGILLKGVGEEFDRNFFQKFLIEKLSSDSVKSNVPQIILSNFTANRLNTRLGAKIIVSYVKNDNLENSVYQVGGIYHTGLEEYDKKIGLTTLKNTQEMLGWKSDQIGGFELFVKDLQQINHLTEHLYFSVISQDLMVESIRQKFASIFDWLELSNLNGWVIWLLMLVVGIITMITTTLILIVERTKMIGLLKALGSKDRHIRRLFFYLGTTILGIGMIIGTVFGLLFCWTQKSFKWIKLPEAEYYISYAPIHINYLQIAMILIGTLVLIALCLFVPTAYIRRISPVKSLNFK